MSTPRNQALKSCLETAPDREVWTYGRTHGAHKASSDVTSFPKDAANRGRTLPAGVMPGAWLVGQVVQREESGSVPQVGRTGRSAVLGAKASTRSSSKSSCAHGKAVVARSSLRVVPGTQENERGDGQLKIRLKMVLGQGRGDLVSPLGVRFPERRIRGPKRTDLAVWRL